LADGSPHAAYALATWHLHGTHAPKDIKKAVRLLKIAANAKVAEANYDLAVAYETGEGLKKNLKKAFQHYLTSALYGDAQGMRETGRCYWHGLGVGRDRAIARQFITRSKELGAKN
jgi:TPR repeat protein